MSGLSSLSSLSGMRTQVLRTRSKRIPLEAEVRHEPVPAPREGLAAAVGLVIEADLDEPVSHETEEVRVGPEVQKDLRLVVGLAERGGKLRVVDLPEGELRVAEPEVRVRPEDAFPELHFQAELEFGLGVLDLRPRVCRFVKLVVLREIVREGENVVLPVGS